MSSLITLTSFLQQGRSQVGVGEWKDNDQSRTASRAGRTTMIEMERGTDTSAPSPSSPSVILTTTKSRPAKRLSKYITRPGGARKVVSG